MSLLAVVQSRFPVTYERVVLEVWAARCEELGTSFLDVAGIFEDLDGGESERLGSYDHSFESDTRPTTSHRLPTMARRSRHPCGSPELSGRNIPTHVTDIRGAASAPRLPRLDLLLGANGLGFGKGLGNRLGKRLFFGRVSHAANGLEIL